MNPVPMTIINPWKEYLLTGGLSKQPVLMPSMLQNELRVWQKYR